MSDVLSERSEGSTAGPADDRPLSQQEYQLLQRLLSDPFSIPIQFKTWLVSYLEASDLNLPISAVNGLVSILGITGVGGGTLGILPAGLIFPFAGTTAPTGSLLCDGSSHLISSYQRLWDAIKDAGWGQPDANSFYVPDIRGRVPVGLGPNANASPLGKNEGLAVANRRPQHKHTVTDPGHQHPTWQDTTTTYIRQRITRSNIGDDEAATESMDQPLATTGISVGNAADALDTPPFVIVNFIIVS